jgi:YggT family protein
MIAQLIQIYVYAIFGRIILSYFPLAPGGAMAGIFSFLYTITEPVLGPLRRVIPPIGPLDVSPMVAMFGLYFIAGALS